MTAFVSNADDAIVSPPSWRLSALIGVHQRLKLRSFRRSFFVADAQVRPWRSLDGSFASSWVAHLISRRADISRQLQNPPPATFLRPSCYQRFCLKCGSSICTEFYFRCEAVVIDIKVVQIYVRSEDSETLFGQHEITSLIVHGILVQQLS
jgi:hypothetical protein